MPIRAILITTKNPFKALMESIVLLDEINATGQPTADMELDIEQGVILTRKKSGWIQNYHGTFDRFTVGKSVEGSLLDFLEDDETICFSMCEFTTENRLKVREMYKEFVNELYESNPEMVDDGIAKVGKVLIAPEEICALFTDASEGKRNK